MFISPDQGSRALAENSFRHDNLPFFGGIAQLVERLVRNEKVRGSNPLTSSLRSHRRAERGLSRRSLGEGGPLFVFTAPTQRATTRQAKIMVKFFYVYILQSQLDPRRFYTGILTICAIVFRPITTGGRLTQRNGTLALKNIY